MQLTIKRMRLTTKKTIQALHKGWQTEVGVKGILHKERAINNLLVIIVLL